MAIAKHLKKKNFQRFRYYEDYVVAGARESSVSKLLAIQPDFTLDSYDLDSGKTKPQFSARSVDILTRYFAGEKPCQIKKDYLEFAYGGVKDIINASIRRVATGEVDCEESLKQQIMSVYKTPAQLRQEKAQDREIY